MESYVFYLSTYNDNTDAWVIICEFSDYSEAESMRKTLRDNGVIAVVHTEDN